MSGIGLRRHSDVVIVDFYGPSFDGASDDVRLQLFPEDASDDKYVEGAVLNFEGVHSIDAGGVASLVAITQELDAGGLLVALASLTPSVEHALFDAHVLDVIPHFESESKAVAAVSGRTCGSDTTASTLASLITDSDGLENCTHIRIASVGASASGPIPTEIALLTQLKRIEVDSGSLVGTLPTELGAFSQLTFFSSSKNALSGPLPTELGSLSRLHSIHASFNSLSGRLPTELSALGASLTALELRSTGLGGTLSSELGELSTLYSLRLGMNSFHGTMPSELGRLTRLTSGFELRSNVLTGPLPSELGLLTSVADLELAQNWLSGSIPTELGKMGGGLADGFNLSQNRLTGRLPTELGRLTLLTSQFLLHSLSLNGTVPTELGALSALTDDFQLHASSLTGTIPTELGQLSLLQRTMYLHMNRLNGRIPSALSSLGAAAGVTPLDCRLTSLPGGAATTNELRAPVPRALRDTCHVDVQPSKSWRWPCADCERHRCTHGRRGHAHNCASRWGFTDPGDREREACRCACCARQCAMPKGCEPWPLKSAKLAAQSTPMLGGAAVGASLERADSATTALLAACLLAGSVMLAAAAMAVVDRLRRRNRAITTA